MDLNKLTTGDKVIGISAAPRCAVLNMAEAPATGDEAAPPPPTPPAV